MSYPRGPGGVSPHHPPDLWADVIDTQCPNCQAAAGAYCVLQANTRTFPKHAPCLSRIRAAEKAAS